MIKTATLAGKDYPVSFGKAALVLFETETGVSVTEISNGASYSNSLRLIWCGLRDGGRKAGTPFPLDFEGFCDLLDEDPEAEQRLIDVFSSSIPAADAGVSKNPPQASATCLSHSLNASSSLSASPGAWFTT